MWTHYLDLFVEFLFSMKWIWLLITILGYRLLRIVAIGWTNKLTIEADRNTIEADKIIRDTEYKEEDVIAHLDYIIKEALDEYTLLYLVPKDIQYINTRLEEEILNYMKEQVPNRISKTLLTHLSFIYNSDYLGDYLAMHIYLAVVDFRLVYNTEREPYTLKSNSA